MAKIADFVRQAFPSMMRSIVADIYLCRTCSCQEILRVETPGQETTPHWSEINGCERGTTKKCKGKSEYNGCDGHCAHDIP